ncbi:MAG: FAD-dependent oxidoreductase [Actinobacteria bacterium]|nr:FAD-dependent oxidoreductase [Actinomycetota bacterium]
MGRLDVEIVVVGGGVMGLATARSLARAGREVALVEQFRVGHEHGSSHGGSRIFRLSYPDAQWVRLALAALPLWRELEAEAGETLIERHGSLDLGDWKPNRDALAVSGIEFEVLGGAEIARRFPLEVDNGETGLFQADGGIVRADAALRALLASAVAAGARVLEETRVTSLEPDGTGVTVAGAGVSLRAGAVVVTAGAWARDLLEPLSVALEVDPTRETVSYFELGSDEPVPSLIDFAEGAGPGQLGYALVAPGIGLKAGIHHTGARTNADEPGVPDATIAGWTVDWVTRRFRGAVPNRRLETCLYTNTADESFVLERHGRIVVGSACSGHGFKFAPIVGERLAALAVNERGRARRA